MIATHPPAKAVIREAECIGCTKCIQACPFDVIIGSASLMHTILEHECTGCGLCIEPCPVDCIELVLDNDATYDEHLADTRAHAKQVRALRDEHEHARAYRDKRQLTQNHDKQQDDKQAKQAYVLAALARARARKSKHE